MSFILVSSCTDSILESRLNNELKNVDGFTRTIAGYLSELKHDSVDEDEDFNSSTTEKIEVSRMSYIHVKIWHNLKIHRFHSTADH
jgi:hypothetical protein